MMRKLWVVVCALFVFSTVLAVNPGRGRSAHAVFLGNSVFKNADWPQLIGRSDVHNASVSDFTSRQLTWVLDHSVLPYKPAYCFIYTGLEDVLLGVPISEIIKSYHMLCDTLRAHAIEPVINSTLFLENRPLINQSVKKLNAQTEIFCREKGILLIDINRSLCRETGLAPHFTTDGMQLTDEAYTIWAAQLKVCMNDTGEQGQTTYINYTELAKERIDRIMKQSPKHVKLVMLGNSITEQGGNWNKRLGFDRIRNSGQGGYTTGQMLWILDTCVIAASPEACFVMGGINDLTLGVPVDQIFENHKRIVGQLIEHDITPVMQSTLYQHNNPENNAHVRLLNQLLKTFCREHDVHFIDLNAHMSGANGLNAEYTTDGTHLTEQGYEVWSDVLREFIKTHKLNSK
ncbi:MAG: GDSL-type esterase/lipase family protein [candidate division KSB1 bacterium]|nr:GDSL-type esterase/lipase family protein [candidate division KSB1 bacterium]